MLIKPSPFSIKGDLVLNPQPLSETTRRTAFWVLVNITRADSAPLCLAQLRKPSCAMRKTHSVTSLSSTAGKPVWLKCTLSLPLSVNSAHRLLTAAASPTWSNFAGCSLYESRWISAAISCACACTRLRPSRRLIGFWIFCPSCSNSSERSASRWLKSSCNSRATLRRSSSWAAIKRPPKSFNASSARFRSETSII